MRSACARIRVALSFARTCFKARLSDLILAYARVLVHGMARYSVLKTVHRHVVSQFPDVLKSKNETIDVWAARISDRVMVLLNHARRLSTPIKWQQAVGCLTAAQVAQLEQLRDTCACEPASPQAEEVPVAPPRKRRLRGQASNCSECSVDSLGLPSFAFLSKETFKAAERKAKPTSPAAPRTPQATVAYPEQMPSPAGGSVDSLFEAALATAPLAPKKTDAKRKLAEAGGVLRPGAVEAEPPAPSRKARRPRKRPASARKCATPPGQPIARPASPPSGHPIGSPSLGLLKLTKATLQSYIQCRDAARDPKWRYVTGFSAKQTPEHQALAEQLFSQVARGGQLSKERVVAMRDEMLRSASGPCGP